MITASLHSKRIDTDYYILAILVSLAFILRVRIIGHYGLSEDEVFKMLAVKDYLNFDFSSNGQHPALCKILMTISVIIFGENEFALRLPNTIISSITVIPIYLLGKFLYNRDVGLMAGLFWAIEINVIAFSTTAKEDPSMVFFWTFAVYYYLKSREDQKNLKWCGIHTGLALASKYTSILLVVLLCLIHRIDKDSIYPTLSLKDQIKIAIPYGILAFLLFNFPIFYPGTIKELLNHYFGSQRPYSSHTGFLMMGHIYSYRPLYSTFLFLLVKTPVLELIVMTIAILLKIRSKSSEDRILKIWLFGYLLYLFQPYGYMRYILVLYPALFIVISCCICQISTFICISFERKFHNPKRAKKWVQLLLIGAISLNILISSFAYSPYYRLYVNEIGGGKHNTGYYFPQDDIYDYKLREAIEYVNSVALPNATIATSVQVVGEFYGRDDLSFINIRDLPDNGSMWNDLNVSFFLVQNSRIYFENKMQIDFIKSNLTLINEFSISSVNVVEVYQY